MACELVEKFSIFRLWLVALFEKGLRVFKDLCGLDSFLNVVGVELYE